MADDYSPDGRDCLGPASQKILQRRDQMLQVPGGWDPHWGLKLNEGAYPSSKGIVDRGPRSRRSHGSTTSSLKSTNSSVTLNKAYPTSFDGLAVERSPADHSAFRTMDSKSTSEKSFGPAVTMHSPGAADVSTEPGGFSRPPSPRSQMNAFRAENHAVVADLYSSPMERFLAQDNDLSDFGDDPRRVEEEWKKLLSLRANALRRRAQLRSKRNELHVKEKAKSSADEAFMKYVREHRLVSLPTSKPDSHVVPGLDVHYSAMQTARDEFGPLEDDYNMLEDLLDEDEFEMAKTEWRVHNMRHHAERNKTAPEEPASPAGHSPVRSLLGVSSNGPEEYHPLHASYLSRLGDLDLAKERYHNMALEQEDILLRQESRLPLGIDLHEMEKQFLAEFPAKAAALQGEITEIEEDIELWRARCIAEGIDISDSSIGSNQSSTEAHNEDDEVILEENQVSQGASIENCMFPLLLPDENILELGVLITEFDEGNKGDRINRWMLHKLQTSALEVNLLVRVFFHLLQILDFHQWGTSITEWQLNVLLHWGKDEANQPAEAFKGGRSRSSAGQSQTSALMRRLPGGVKSSIKTPPTTRGSPKILRRVRSAPTSTDFERAVKG